MFFICLLLIVACVFDYSKRKIPNELQCIVLTYGLAYKYLFFSWKGVAGYIITVFIITASFYPFFMIGKLGAGDVKLLALTGAFFKKETILWFLLLSFAAALLAAAIKIVSSGRNVKEECKYIKNELLRIWTHIFITENHITTGIYTTENYISTGNNVETENYLTTGNHKVTENIKATGKKEIEKRTADKRVIMSGPILVSVIILLIGGIY